jgi:hypothetical protein
VDGQTQPSRRASPPSHQPTTWAKVTLAAHERYPPSDDNKDNVAEMEEVNKVVEEVETDNVGKELEVDGVDELPTNPKP